MRSSTLITLLCAAASSVVAYPHPSVSNDHFEVIALRADTTVNPAAVTGTTCTNEGYDFPPSHDLTPPQYKSEKVKPSQKEAKLTTSNPPYRDIVFHDQNVAELAICGGIAGTIEFCGGNPASTVGESGTAKFTLNAVNAGATINISKGRWEGCVRAARAVCPTGGLSSTCIGGATTGNVAFTLAEA